MVTLMPRRPRPSQGTVFLDHLCYVLNQEAAFHRAASDSNFLRRKRRIKVKLDSRLAALILAGIAA